MGAKRYVKEIELPRLLREFVDGVRFTVQVKARSQETKLIIEPDGTISLRVVAPPERGAANKEVVKWFAKKFQLPSSQVRLVSGYRSKTKVIEISNVGRADVVRVLGLSAVRLE